MTDDTNSNTGDTNININSNTNDTDFNFGPLGEERWRELASECNATQQQMRFACALSNGSSAAGAARLAGYAGDHDAIRQAAYKAKATKAVRELLVIAEAELAAEADGVMSTAEVKAKLSKIARNADVNTQMRAMELLSKLETKEADRH